MASSPFSKSEGSSFSFLGGCLFPFSVFVLAIVYVSIILLQTNDRLQELLSNFILGAVYSFCFECT